MTRPATNRWEGAPVRQWQESWAIPSLHVFESVSSTNDVARRLAEDGAPAGTTVIADEQTAGRGRLGRRWIVPRAEGLLLSIVLRPAAGTSDATAAAVIRIGLGVADAIDAIADVDVGLKWPNDLQIDGRKLAGILCEGSIGGPLPGFIVAGIGVNVRQTPDSLPHALDQPATSLRIATDRILSRASLAGAIIERLRPFEGAFDTLDEDARTRFTRRDVLAGRRVTVDDSVTGTAAGLTPDGALVLRTDGGRRITHSGTVRSAPPSHVTDVRSA
jgi:BirA family biotin operon repressor/biotin-[acetyl-CoA-carboxylase] ligase